VLFYTKRKSGGKLATPHIKLYVLEQHMPAEFPASTGISAASSLPAGAFGGNCCQ